MKRKMQIAELLSTEETYYEKLLAVRDVFLAELEPLLLSNKAAQLLVLMGKAKDLVHFHTEFLAALKPVVATWSDASGVGPVFRAHCEKLPKPYALYATNFDGGLAELTELMKRPPFAQSLRELEAKHNATRPAPTTLSALLLEPIQRNPRYLMLIQGYLKRTPKDHPDVPAALEGLKAAETTGEHINEQIRTKENHVKLLELETMIDAYVHDKVLVMTSEMQKVCRRGLQPRFVALFTDTLLCCEIKKTIISTQYIATHRLNIPDEIESVKPVDSTMAGADYAFGIVSRKVKSIVLVAKNKEELTQWMKAINKLLGKTVAASGEEEAVVIGFSAPVWIPDAGVSMCMMCRKEFNVIRRRHHCRGCGKVVCGPCSMQEVPLKYLSGKKGRVCTECYDTILGQSTGQTTGQAAESTPERDWKRRPTVRQSKVASVAGGILVSGYLNKRGRTLGAWNRRFYTVDAQLRLNAYRAPEDPEVYGEPLQLSAEFRVGPPFKQDSVEREHVFKLSHRSRDYFFACDTEEQCDLWIDTLSDALAVPAAGGALGSVIEEAEADC